MDARMTRRFEGVGLAGLALTVVFLLQLFGAELCVRYGVIALLASVWATFAAARVAGRAMTGRRHAWALFVASLCSLGVLLVGTLGVIAADVPDLLDESRRFGLDGAAEAYVFRPLLWATLGGVPIAVLVGLVCGAAIWLLSLA